ARCLSYLTQCPGVVPEVIRPLLGNLLYGCDRCQEVCPYNQGLVNTARPEGLFPFFPAEPRLIPILSMTRKEFSSTIALTAAGWRGKTTLQRNAVIALGNLKHREAVAPLIRMLAQDPRPVIRLHAAWSLGAIGGARARFYLEKCRQQDPHGPVREEARKALENTE
ncbi:MAG TPA: epoxyqueuosine reductase, partial [Firmicutes bacterium]|nr:epoxyqueuosine reductase [Bacillota bacterium]